MFIVAAALDSYDFSKKESPVDYNFGSENKVIAIRGPFSFIGDDGQVYTVSYFANENGYQVIIDISGLILKNIFDYHNFFCFEAFWFTLWFQFLNFFEKNAFSPATSDFL